MKLTDRACRAAAPTGERYKMFDGAGLCLVVSPTGAKSWNWHYRESGKAKTISFGAYPEVTLAEARARRDDGRRRLRDGQPPVTVENTGPTFGEIVNIWLDGSREKWAASYSARVETRMKCDILPALGRRPLGSIKPPDVLRVVKQIEDRGAPEMARRVLKHCSAVFRFAVASGLCEIDPTANLGGAIIKPSTGKPRTALPAAELPEFFARLNAHPCERLTAMAIRFTMLTFVRTNEVRFARWSEFEGLDGPEPLWRIPAERMKMKRAHLVPLAPQVVRLLGEIRRQSAGDLLFPANTRTGTICENTMLYALYDMGYRGRATIHGFRGLASTVLNEQGFDGDCVELQLAHVQGAVRGAYNHALKLPKRREMMNWWADYLDRREAEGLVG